MLLTKCLRPPYASLILGALPCATNGKAAGSAGGRRRNTMGITIFLALCLVAEGFLVHVLVQFVREGRRNRTAHHSRHLTEAPSSEKAGAVWHEAR